MTKLPCEVVAVAREGHPLQIAPLSRKTVVLKAIESQCAPVDLVVVLSFLGPCPVNTPPGVAMRRGTTFCIVIEPSS